MIRELLGFLPSNNLEEPPFHPTEDDPYRRDARLQHLVPENPHRPYDMKAIIKAVVDEGYFYETHKGFAENIIVAFARLGGRTVGIELRDDLFELAAGAPDRLGPCRGLVRQIEWYAHTGCDTAGADDSDIHTIRQQLYCNGRCTHTGLSFTQKLNRPCLHSRPDRVGTCDLRPTQTRSPVGIATLVIDPGAQKRPGTGPGPSRTDWESDQSSSTPVIAGLTPSRLARTMFVCSLKIPRPC